MFYLPAAQSAEHCTGIEKAQVRFIPENYICLRDVSRKCMYPQVDLKFIYTCHSTISDPPKHLFSNTYWPPTNRSFNSNQLVRDEVWVKVWIKRKSVSNRVYNQNLSKWSKQGMIDFQLEEFKKLRKLSLYLDLRHQQRPCSRD